MRDRHEPPLDDRASFRHWTFDKLRFSDTDQLGHVNNVAFATFCETGRATFMREETGPDLAGHVFVIVRLAIDFRAEIHYPGNVEIGTRVLSVGRSSFALGQGLFKDGRCHATAEAVLALMSEETRRAAPLPAALRARLGAL